MKSQVRGLLMTAPLVSSLHTLLPIVTPRNHPRNILPREVTEQDCVQMLGIVVPTCVATEKHTVLGRDSSGVGEADSLLVTLQVGPVLPEALYALNIGRNSYLHSQQA